jgi:GT2 family glycosyltransferase
MEIAILVPTYGRSDRLQKVYENIVANTSVPHNVYFILEAKDKDSANALPQEFKGRIIRNYRKPCYAGAINTAYLETDEPFLFAGSDDLNFHKGWDTEIFKVMESDPKIQVVGTNDLLNRDVLAGKTATHYLFSRSYIAKNSGTFDKSAPVLFEYEHNYTDREFIDTAIKRGVFAPCLTSIVEHMHYGNKKNTWDETYERNQSTLSIDKATYEVRMQLLSK